MNLREYLVPYREKIPVLREINHLNSGAMGPNPQPVYEAINEAVQCLYKKGQASVKGREYINKLEAAARAEIAVMIHAEPNEIVLCRSISEMVNMVNYMMSMEEEEESLISSQENHAVVVATMTVAKHCGFQVTKFAAEGGLEDIQKSFENAVTPKTRLAAFSHVLHALGSRLPVKEMCSYARERGVYTFIDGAQAVGTVPIDVKELGCDFYALCTHKWLGSMIGVSALYIRKELISRFTPSLSGAGGYESFDFYNNEVVYLDSAKRFEFGGRPLYLYAGVNAAIHFAKEIGFENIYAREHELVRYTREQVRKILPQAEVISPKDEEQETAIFVLHIPGVDHNKLIQAALKENILIQPRNIDLYEAKGAVRLSLNWFVREEEINQALEFIGKFAE